MYLQDCEIIEQEIEYGTLGTYGNLGYSIIPSVNNVCYQNIISAHPNSVLKFKIPKAKYFSCKLALNDSSNDFTSADFEIYADDVLMHYSKNVSKKEVVDVFFNLNKNETITLKCTYNTNSICHALYLDAALHEKAPEYFLDSMYLSKVKNLSYEEKIVVSSFIDKNYIPYADNLCKQIKKSSKEKIKFAFFCPEDDKELQEFCSSISALYIPIKDKFLVDISSKGKHTIYSKATSFSIAKIIDADKYIIIDQDILLCGDFDNLLDEIENASDGEILICKDAHTEGISFGEILTSSWSAYEGSEECQKILNLSPEEFQNDLVINSGVIAGNKKALLALDDQMRRLLPKSLFYLEENSTNTLREQSLVNLALIKYGSYKEIHKKYNLQAIWEEFDLSIQNGKIKCNSLGFSPIFLHFNGPEAKKILNSSITAIANKSKYEYSKHSIAKDLCKDIKHTISILDLQNDDVILKSFQTHLQNSNTYKLFNSKLIKNNIEEEIKDEFLYLLSLQESKHKFDFIVISNMDSEINIARQLMICKHLLSKDGKIIFKQYHQSEYTFEHIQNKNIDLEDLKILFEYERNSTEQTLLIK